MFYILFTYFNDESSVVMPKVETTKKKIDSFQNFIYQFISFTVKILSRANSVLWKTPKSKTWSPDFNRGNSKNAHEFLIFSQFLFFMQN